MERCDILIVGAGVAGTSLAWALSKRAAGRIVLVEKESAPALHASGRSARTMLESDPNPTIQRLKLAASSFFKRPPAGFSARPLLEQRGALGLLAGRQAVELERSIDGFRDAGLVCELLTARAACALCDALDERAFDAALFLPESGFIDVDALLGMYVAQAVAAGVSFRYGAGVAAIECVAGSGAYVEVGKERIYADTVVNAAGAWAGELASRTGCAPVALTPLRRSLALYEPPRGARMDEWPLVGSDGHNVYFRPLGDELMICPMDTETSAPCDARPVAAVFDEAHARMRSIAPSLAALTLRRAWAGLRTFSDDCVPVIGRDLRQPSLFWLAGQGGCGIETSPVVAELAADLLLDGTSTRFDASIVAPGRFAG